MDLTQEQINSQKLPLRKKFIKIELLNADLQVIDSLEGVALDGNITRNADNTIRGSGNISLAVAIDKSKTTFLDQINYMTINYNGKIWLDKRLKIYVGIETNGNIVWNKMGVYLMDKPLRDFSATQYSISFNIVDQMALLTGERQGQLTGLGVEIPQFTEATSWDDGLFYAKEDASYGVDYIDTANNEIISESQYYEGISGNIYVATLASDKRTVAFYTKYSSGGNFTQRSIGLPSQLDNIDIVSIHYVPNAVSKNFLALGSNGYLYIMTDEFNSLSATLTFESSLQITNIVLPSLIYSTTNYYVATDNGYIYFINKSTSAITRTFIGTIVKLKAMSSVLFYLEDDGANRTIGAIKLSDLTNITSLPFQSYNDIKDFDTNSNTLSIIRDIGGYKLYSYSTSDNGLTFSALPIETPYIQSLDKVTYLVGPYDTQNYFVVGDTISSVKNFYLFKIDNSVVRQINSFDLSVANANYFNVNYIEFLNAMKEPAGPQDLSTYLVVFGVGTATAISTTFSTVGYQVSSSLTDIPQRTYDALSQVLSSLSIIKRFAIHPITGDFEYLPYDIKVGTSATVWDIVNKFMEILSTWQAYFDLDGVLRIEPIPSGADSIVYPLSSEVYISDQNDYDFNNVKNQVVVYGKANEASYVATKVSLNATKKTLTLDFDSIDTNALGIKTTKFAFETSNMTPNVNIEKIILQSGEQWQRSTSTFTYSYPTTMQYLDNAWYVLSSLLYRSADGTNWSVVHNYRINKIISNGSIYVGLGNQSIYYSEDNGETWAQATISGSLPSGAHYLDIDYGGGTFMASFTNTQNSFATSSDGKNWTIGGTLAIYSSWAKMKYANGLWVGITSSASTYDGIYTYNGSQWGAFSTPNEDYVCVDYINNKWFVGGDTTGIYTSTDGSTWTHIESIKNITPYSFAYGNGVYVAAVHNYYSGLYTSLLYSTNGTDWYRSPSFISNSTSEVVFNGSAFVASSEDGIYYSTDGINWSQIYNSNRLGVPMAISDSEIKVLDLSNSLNYVYSLTNIEKRTQITASFVAFENSQSYVSSNEFSEKDVYIVRFIEGSVDANNVIITTQPLTMEYYSRLQPRWCLVDENTDSSFYVNRTLNGENYYAGTSLNDNDATYALWLKGFSGVSLNDGTLITFMANKNNTKNPTISVYNEDGTTQLVSEVPIVGTELYTYGTNTRVRGDFAANLLSNDYSIHLIKYIASINSFEYLGISPSVYSLVLSGGEYDNIHADRLAYERCLWELYSHTNLQDNLTLGIVPDYALDVNMKIPYDPANSVPIGMSRPSEQQYFLTKQISYPLAANASPQTIKAIRIYDDGGLLG